MTGDEALARFRRIHEPVEARAEELGRAPALVDHDGRRLAWAELDGAVRAMEARLAGAGVRPGDRVMVVMENAAVAVAALLACSRIGAWPAMVNARLTSPEIARIRAHCGPRAMVFTAAASRDAARHADEAGAGEADDPTLGSFRLLPGLAAEPEPVDGTAGDVAALIYTSGTTGEPKGVMLTHRGLLFVATVSGGLRRLAPGDHVYGVLPASHVFGLASTCLGTLAAGATLQCVPRFDPAHLAGALAEGVTVFQGVPAMFAKLLEHLDARGRPLAAPRLRYMSSGGAPLDLDWKRRIEARFGIPLNNGYGLTECSPTIAQTLIEDPRSDDGVGPLLPGLRLRLAGPDGGEAAPGEVGEVWVAGPNVMRGYYRDPAATAAAVTPEGFLRTGDLGRLGPDGCLFIVGRAKELIIRSGFNVYPPEVETALNAHPAVLQSAVIGRRVKGDEEVIAFVEAVPGASLDEATLQAFAAERLAPYKRPRRIFVLDRLPATSTGKLQKHELRPVAEWMLGEAG